MKRGTYLTIAPEYGNDGGAFPAKYVVSCELEPLALHTVVTGNELTWLEETNVVHVESEYVSCSKLAPSSLPLAMSICEEEGPSTMQTPSAVLVVCCEMVEQSDTPENNWT